jgi:hypothetical protein
LPIEVVRDDQVWRAFTGDGSAIRGLSGLGGEGDFDDDQGGLERVQKRIVNRWRSATVMA